MSSKWYLSKLVTNTEGQDAPSIQVFTGDSAEEDVKVSYHNTLASYHNASDVLYAVVEILRELDGSVYQSEIVDHRPPEPEVKIVSIEEVDGVYTVTYSDGRVEIFPEPVTE